MVGAWVVCPMTLTQSLSIALGEAGSAQPESGTARVLELPAPLEGVDRHGGTGIRRRGVDLVLGQHGEDEEDDHDDDRHRGVDDFGEGVVLGLLRHLVGLPAVPEDGPDDQEEDEAPDHQAGDEEALPQVELGPALRGGPLVLPKGGQRAAREEEGDRQKTGSGHAATSATRLRNWGLRAGRRGRRAGQ